MAIQMVMFGAALALFAGGASAQTCEVQSCTIAQISGSTGTPYTGGVANAPTGGTAAGDQCIASYGYLGAYTGPFPSSSRRFPKRSEKAWKGTELMRRASEEAMAVHAPVLEERQSACAPYTLIFARGTTEPGTLGGSVGPALQTGLNSTAPGQWNIQGVPYNATVDGDECLGLPGGVIATAQIESVASQCPDTKVSRKRVEFIDTFVF